jgi:2'-5' RNA ligase
MRLFLALEIPDRIRRLLAGMRGDLEHSWPGWRWVRPEGIHLTLRFLGEVEPALDAECRQAWADAVVGISPFDLRLGRLGRFPGGGKPRVLWVGLEEPGGEGQLAGLAARVENSARECGFPPEKRPFRPHLTLARAARGARPHWADGIRIETGEPFSVGSLVLFRSQLNPSGARYTALERFELKGRNG